jgi:hypothetical protein
MRIRTEMERMKAEQPLIDLTLRSITPAQANAILALIDDGPTSTAPNGALATESRALEETLSRADTATRALVESIIEYAANLESTEDPAPERPKDGGRPRYFRLARNGRTYAYVWMRRDHARITLGLEKEAAVDIDGGIEVRGVKASNRFKLAVRLRTERDLAAARSALARAHAEAA